MKHTIENLKLNLEEARKGRTWLLLPEEYRDHRLAAEYPIPAWLNELQIVATLPIRPRVRDAGTIYVRRCIREWKQRLQARAGSVITIERAEHGVLELEKRFEERLQMLESKSEGIVKRFQEHTDRAIASLDELFRLGREGIEGQMRAHLAGETWKDEQITARAFRECFRMVSQTVKGLGLPSEQQEKAREVVIAEAAASLRATQEAVAMQKASDGEVEH